MHGDPFRRRHAAAGRRRCCTDRPFRAPHHTISDVALVGGGAVPRPGEISLAHHGVLFLDEMPEFSRHVLDVLRQPLEEGRITVARAARTVAFPARFVLVAAMNPCPCGYRGDPERACRCTPQQVAKYRGRLSGPLLDRIDLIVDVQPVAIADLTGDAHGESSAAVRARVLAARERQLARPGARRAAQREAARPRVRSRCVRSMSAADVCSNDRRSGCTSPRAAFTAS